MKYLINLFCFLAFFVSLANSQCVDYEQNTVIVKFVSSYEHTFLKSDYANKLIAAYGDFVMQQEFPNSAKPKETYNRYGQKCVDITNIYRLQFKNNVNVGKIVSYLQKCKYVEYAEPLYRVRLLDVPNDPYLLQENANLDGAFQYWANSISAYEAWEIAKGDTSIVIGISDTGTSLQHPDLDANIKNNYNDLPDGIDNDADGYIDNFQGWNFAYENNNPQVPQQGESREHGAFVSGIASAVANNGVGVAGAGYNCKFVPLRIMDDDNTLVNVYQSIVYAANHHFDVVNCSWGSTSYQQMAQDVIWYATINNDLLVVAAAGNEGVEGKFFPASYENVLSVAATDINDEKWRGSSYSTSVDVSAPGTMFVSTSENGYATMWGGTSFASPIVAGCAGILRSFYPNYNAQQIAEIIRISSDNIDTLYRVVADSTMLIDSVLVYESYIYDTTYIDVSYRDYFNSNYAGMLGKGRINLHKALTLNEEEKFSTLLNQISLNRYDDVLDVAGLLTNYLNARTNLEIHLQVESEFITIDDTVLYVGNMQVMQADTISQIRLFVAENAPQELTVKMKITYISDEIITDQVVSLIVNGGFVDIETANLSLSIAGNGRLGYVDLYSQIGHGFNYNNYYELIADCGVISGFSDEEIFSSVRQLNDFYLLEYPHFIDDTLAQMHVFARMNDSLDYNSRQMEYLLDVYADDDDFIILDYKIVNNSYDNYDNYYFGLFADWDLFEPTNNSSIFDVENGLLYCKYDEGSSIFAGIKLLSSQQPKNYSLINAAGGDGRVDISDGFSDVEKFRLISTSTITDSCGDIIQYSGAGPFTLFYQDTAEIVLALLVSNSYHGLVETMNKAEQKYYYLKGDNIENYSQVIDEKYFNIYPNPNIGNFSISVADCMLDEEIQILDISGRVVFAKLLERNDERIVLDGINSGVYFVRVGGVVEKIVVSDR